jgi:hypothetical protein
MILFSCRRVSEISSKELDTRLRLTELVCAGAHRAMCGACGRYRAQLRALDRAVRAFVRAESDDGDATLPEASKARIAAHLRASAADDGAGGPRSVLTPPGAP